MTKSHLGISPETPYSKSKPMSRIWGEGETEREPDLEPLC
jgi:hypothetical protein